RRRCSPRSRSRATPRSISRSPAICAAAAPTRASARRFERRPALIHEPWLDPPRPAAESEREVPGLRIVRRSFLTAVNLTVLGLAVGWFEEAEAADAKAAAAPATTTPGSAPGLQPNVFIHVAASGEVTLVCHRSEMGQGIRSSLPFLFADELGADMARVRVVQGDGDKAYGDQNTDGSSSIRNRYEELRRIAATARSLLVAAAAKRWGVTPASCKAKHNQVTHAASG